MIKNSTDIHFDLNDELINTFSQLDQSSIRTVFKQATDPVNLAFKHVENKSLSYLAKDFIKSSAADAIEFISGMFK